MLEISLDCCRVSKGLIKSVLIFVSAAGATGMLYAFHSHTEFSEQCRNVIANFRTGEALIDAQQTFAYCISAAGSNEMQSLTAPVIASAIFAALVGVYIWMKDFP